MNVSNICSTRSTRQTPIQDSFQQRGNNFRTLGRALRSGDLTAAQSALAAFQQKLQKGSNASTEGSQPFSQNSQAATDFQSLQSALESGDLSAAQKAFANLKTDLHGAGHAHRGHQHHPVETQNNGDADGGAQATPTSTTPAETVGSVLDTQV